VCESRRAFDDPLGHHAVEQKLVLLPVHQSVPARKVDVRLPGEGNSSSHRARPVHLIISVIKWNRTSRLSIKNSLSLVLLPVHQSVPARFRGGLVFKAHRLLYHSTLGLRVIKKKKKTCQNSPSVHGIGRRLAG